MTMEAIGEEGAMIWTTGTPEGEEEAVAGLFFPVAAVAGAIPVAVVQEAVAASVVSAVAVSAVLAAVALVAVELREAGK